MRLTKKQTRRVQEITNILTGFSVGDSVRIVNSEKCCLPEVNEGRVFILAAGPYYKGDGKEDHPPLSLENGAKYWRTTSLYGNNPKLFGPWLLDECLRRLNERKKT